MAYILLDENNIVVQKSVRDRTDEGFIQAPNDVVCGQIKKGNAYVNPPPVKREPKEFEILMKALEMKITQEEKDAAKAELMK